MKKNRGSLGLGVLIVTGMFFLSLGLNPEALAGDVPENLALHGTASVCSVHEHSPHMDASKLNDGWYYDESYTHVWIGGLSDYLDDYLDPATPKKHPHRDSWWAQVDLGAVKQVGAVAFGSDTVSRTPKNFIIQVSTDSVKYSDWIEVSGRNEPGRVVHGKPEPVSARYVKILITDTDGLREQGNSPCIDEIEIYGSMDEAMTAPKQDKDSSTRPKSNSSAGLTFASAVASVPDNPVTGKTSSGVQSSASFTIAASNSLSQSKARADYICDGIDDHLEIQAAIDALPDTDQNNTGGGSIQLLEGTFNIGASIKFYDKAVSLLGTGRYSTTLMLQKRVNDDMFVIGTGEKQGMPPGRIAHMSLNGRSRFQSIGSGIRMKSGDMMVIEDVRVYDFKENGIFLEGTSMGVRPAVGTIEDCRIEYNKKHGIYIGPGIEGWIIRGNRIGDNGTLGQPFHGIYIEAKHGEIKEGPHGASNAHLIVNNVLWQNECTQICINGGGHGGAHMVIANNIILSSPYENIKLYDGTHLVTITGNVIHSASEVEIGGAPHITLENVSHVVVSNNAISSPSRGLASAAMVKAGAKSGEVINMPAPSAILIEKGSSDHNKFIGNIIHGDVTDVILVGEHSFSDSKDNADNKKTTRSGKKGKK